MILYVAFILNEGMGKSTSSILVLILLYCGDNETQSLSGYASPLSSN